MTTIKAGDEVRVTEHNDATCRPIEGGESHPAEVILAGGIYVQVRYTDGPHKGRKDTFWAESGWRAWDGEFHWRLEVSAL